MSEGRGYRSVLQVHDARSLIAASAASQLGDWLYNAALLAYIYEATGSAAWVGAATIVRLLPYVLLGPIGGLIADRYDRRSVLLAGDLARLAAMLGIAAVVAMEGPVQIVVGLTAVASAAGTAERPAAMAILPRLVGELRLGPANALLHTVQDAGVVVGPALGAVLLAVAPPATAFLANAATFAVSAAFVAKIRRQPPPPTAESGEGAIAQLRSGLRAARSTRYVVPLLAAVSMAEFTYGAQTVQLVLYAEDGLGLGAEGYGYLLAVTGLGGVLSALVNGRLASSIRVADIVVVSGVAFSATQIVYGLSHEIWLAIGVTLLGGAGVVACEVVAETALARIVKPEALGRLMGLFDAISVAAMVLGAVSASVLISSSSLPISLIVLGVAAVAITAAARLGLRGLTELSRARTRAVAARLAVVEALPIVEGAPRMVLEQLASAAHMCPLPDGVDVVVEGAPAHAFYVVVDGSAVVHRDGTEIARIGRGGYFGERGLLDNAPRNATVTTSEQSILLRLDGGILLDALQSAPSVRSALDRSHAQLGAHQLDGPLVDDPDWSNL